jgi:hypothetical protein
MDRTAVLTRRQHAHSFIDAADLVLQLGHDAGISYIANTVGSLAVLAGIAAADAICGVTPQPSSPRHVRTIS